MNNINTYIKRKIENICVNGIIDDIISSMIKALEKFAVKHNYMFDHYDFFESFVIEDRNADYIDIDRIPDALQTYSQYYEYETEQGNQGEYGWYVHMLNKNVENIETYLRHLAQIDGEICLSDLDEIFSNQRSKIGVIFSGTPTKSFDYDCWSEIDPYNGKRYATRTGAYSNHTEHWMTPIRSKIEGLIYCDNTKEIVLSAAKKLNLTTIHYKSLKKEEAA